MKNEFISDSAVRSKAIGVPTGITSRLIVAMP